ncbi:UvrD-helicase domain-containing protein [bacterium]|nr:UvrD-helicase domain-containing protein [bacterium]
MSDKQSLQDADARKLIETSLDESLLVEAAAGTGKTTLLISRILNLILTKEVSLTRIVAITFTEKAAGELKQRLRAELEKQIQNDPASEQAARFRDALTELDLMPVNTIHGFCRDLIQQLPIEAEVDPDFTVLDDAGETALKDEFWESWLTEQLAAECVPLRPLFELDLPLTPDSHRLSLRELFDDLVENNDTLDRLQVTSSDQETLSDSIESLNSLLREGEGLLEQCLAGDDKLLLAVRALHNQLPAAISNELEPWLRGLADVKLIKTSRLGNKNNWTSAAGLQDARDWLNRVMEQIAATRSALFSYYAATMIDWLKGATSEFANLKRERGCAGFQDLLVVARDLLQKSEPARRYFKNCYDYLLIDEFQDTDPLQTEIIFYLAEEENRHAQDWMQVKVKSGKLFIVGDPKQSIYRFRRADLDLYAQVKEKFSQTGRIVHINVSFRAVQPLIEEINEIFAPQMTGGPEGCYEPDYVAMVPHRLAHHAETAIELMPPPKGDSSERSAQQTAEQEAAALAEHIRKLYDSDALIGDGEQRRKVAWGDIAVLTRVWSNTYLLEQAFRAREIPFSLPTDRVFSERAEIMAIRTLFRALLNPFDEVHVVGALRSSLLACSDDELLLHRARGGSFNYLTDTIAQGHLGDCLLLLRELHAKQYSLTPSELLDEALAATHNSELLALKPQGIYRLDALRKLSDYIRTLEDSGRSLSQIVRLLNSETFLKTIGEADLGDAATNRVSILTFFKAKGLEYPVVLLYDLAHTGRDTQHIYYDRNSGRFEFSMRETLCTSGFEQAKEQNGLRRQREELRLLYVAMTRARDKLVIPLYWLSTRKRKPAGLQNYLLPHYAQAENDHPLPANHRSQLVDIRSYDLSRLPREQLEMNLLQPFSEQAVEKARNKLAGWQERHAKALRRLDRAHLFGTASQQKTKLPPAAPNSNGNSHGARFGSLVHEVLELIDEPKPLELKTLVQDISAKYGLSGADAEQAEKLIHDMLTSPHFRQYFMNAERIFRELPFSVILDDVLYEGKMDLVWVENGQSVILDYKTDHGTPEELLEKYQPQARVYAGALEQITGMRIKEVILYHVRSNTPVALTRETLSLKP